MAVCYRPISSKAVLNLPCSRNMEMGEFALQQNVRKGKAGTLESSSHGSLGSEFLSGAVLIKSGTAAGF